MTIWIDPFWTGAPLGMLNQVQSTDLSVPSSFSAIALPVTGKALVSGEADVPAGTDVQ